MALIFLILLFVSAAPNPQLLHISTKNECIKVIVSEFITSQTCQKLSQNLKSQLALKMTDCLFEQMNKPPIVCASKTKCELSGDSWYIYRQKRNTFTTFFAHIDNLCHFYWDISKAERAEQMIDALMSSAQNTEKTLKKNNQNTKQILELQTALRLQILSSIATQEQMSQIINNSSVSINTLTSEISASLNRIHADIDEHYAVITRILSAVNQVLKHLDSLHLYLVAQVRSVQGVLFFVSLTLLTLIGCLISQKVRLRKNQCLILISIHFLLEFFFSSTIHSVIGVQPMRCISIIVIIILIISAKLPISPVEQTIYKQLNSQRLGRILERAMRKQIYYLNKKFWEKSNKNRQLDTPSPTPDKRSSIIL